MTVARRKRSHPIWGNAFLDELEDTRAQFTGGGLLRGYTKSAYKEEVVAANRRTHIGIAGGDHKFVGEKYLNSTDKELRRRQLRKAIDEGGETTVLASGAPSHPTLANWTSFELGISEQEINELERRDMLPETLISKG